VPDAQGNIRGIVLSGRAGETLEKVFGKHGPRPNLVCPQCGGEKWVNTTHDQIPYCSFCLHDMDYA
jgi:hypothetical protein